MGGNNVCVSCLVDEVLGAPTVCLSMNWRHKSTGGGKEVLNGSEGAQREDELILGLFRKVPTGPRGGRRDRDAERQVRVRKTRRKTKK